jgi:hypothetical protein
MTGAMGTGGHTVGILGEWRLLREWAAGGWLRRGQLDVEPQGGAAGLGVGTRVSSNGTRGGRAGTGMVMGDGIRDALRTWGVGRCCRRVAGLDLALLQLRGAVLEGDREAALLAV